MPNLFLLLVIARRGKRTLCPADSWVRSGDSWPEDYTPRPSLRNNPKQPTDSASKGKLASGNCLVLPSSLLLLPHSTQLRAGTFRGFP